MGFHNPFLKDGLIKFPDNGSVVKHVEKWAKVRGDKVAYRFLDYSVERDGVAREVAGDIRQPNSHKHSSHALERPRRCDDHHLGRGVG